MAVEGQLQPVPRAEGSQREVIPIGEAIANIEKKIQSTMGAMQQMKRANKYDKSISAKHKMIERMQQEG